MQSSEVKPFSRLRAWLCPIHRSEFPKFIPLFLLAFFVGFNYSLLKSMKDTLVVVGTNAGAEIIPFLKVWGIVPGAVIITVAYGWMSSRFSRDVVFYTFIGGFIGFFFVFTFIIYPLGDRLCLHSFADKLQDWLPEGWKGFVSMVRFWSYSLYYVIAELWSSVVLSTLFWGIANEVSSINEASRFYALIHAGLNFASIFAGEISYWAGKHSFMFFTFQDHWYETMANLTILISLAGLAIVYLYRRLHLLTKDDYLAYTNAYLKQEQLAQEELAKQGFGEKRKPQKKAKGLFLYLVRSRYLLGIAVIVLSYNLVIHLFEVVWKDQVRQIYRSPVEFNSYMSRITTLIGIISFLAAIFAVNQTIRRWGWRFGALASPVVMLVTGVLFFWSVYAVKKDIMTAAISWLGFSPLVLTAWIGGMQNVLSRATKFTFFDQTKEMAFIPLPNNEKNYGKAAIDGVVSRVGKSSGSLVYQSLLIVFSSVAASLNVIAVVLLLIIVVWISVVVYIGREYSLKEAAAIQLENSIKKSSAKEAPLSESLTTSSFKEEVAPL